MADGTFRRKAGFTVVQNDITRDKTISLKAKGLYLLIQSYITMPEKSWKKIDFINMSVDGKKGFESAWVELKEKGYLKVHFVEPGKPNGFEYELLDSPQLGPHTFYYNKKGEVTRTNLGTVVANQDEDSFEIDKCTQDDAASSEIDAISMESPKGVSHERVSPEQGYHKMVSHYEESYQRGYHNQGDSITTSDINTNIINTNNINTVNTINHSEAKGYWNDVTDEIISEYIFRLRSNIEYDFVKSKEREDEFMMYNTLYNILEEFIKNPPKEECVKIGNAEVAYDKVIDVFMNLRYSHLNCVRDKLKGTDFSKVTSFSKYALTVLYNTAKTPEAFLKPLKEKESSFNKIKKRTYDMDALLKAAKVN